MPPSSHKKDPTPPKILAILNEAQRRAQYFLTPDCQPCAALPTGQSVPLHSADFSRWLASTLYEQGVLHPSPQLNAAALRSLDHHAHSTLDFRPLHLRSVETKPNHYLIDIHSNTHAIEINGKEWKITEPTGLHFRRPITNLPHPNARLTQPKLDQYLELSFKITEAQAQALTDWMVLALLPTSTPPPFLIIRGKARDQATRIIRNLIDPSVNPILALPTTPAQIGTDLAMRNRVLAFTLFGQLSKGRIAALKAIRIGTPIPLREKNKQAGQIETHVQRPIIISTDEELKFEADKLELEINETVDTYVDEFLGALLSAAVEAIREYTRQPARHQFSEHEVPPRPPLQAPKTPAPYS